MDRLSLWEKIVLWFRRVISGRADEEVFLTFRLGQARDRARNYPVSYVDFEKEIVRRSLPEVARPVCRQAIHVRDFFRVLWRDTDSLRRVLDYLLARRIPDAKRSLSQFCSTQEMQETFRTTESKSQLKQLVLDRVGEYVDSIPPSVIEEIENGLKPLYLLKDLALFDFDEFFLQFQSDENEAQSTEEVEFHEADAKRVLDQLELLYLALYNASRIPGEPLVYPELLNYYLAFRADAIDPNDPTAIPESDQTPRLRAQISQLVREARAVREAVPLVEIIRYFREDPYYRFIAYVPTLKLREFYYSNLKIEALAELDRRFHDLRMGVVGQLIAEVFPKGLKQFEFFHPEIPSAIKRSGVGQLLVYRSLQVIHTFLQSVYRTGLLEFLRILGRLIPVRSRQSGVELTLAIAGMDDVGERLQDFDLSFSPESDEGKTFFRFRYTSNERDGGQVAAFKALVNQKERDATIIIEKFQDQVRAIKQNLELVKKSPHEHLNERYQTFEGTLADPRPFDARLESYLHTLESCEKILNQMIRLDHEG